MVINTATLKDNPDLGKALTGIWYETIALMKSDSADGKAAGSAQEDIRDKMIRGGGRSR